MVALAVLISTYKADDAFSLDKALRSIFNQCLPPYYSVNVYLGIDGPIGVELEQIISFHACKIYKVIRSQQNEGLAVMLNKLISALGDESFIFRMDADDESLSERFLSQLNYFQDHPDVDILGTDIIELDRDANQSRHVSFAKDHREAVSKICYRTPVAHPTVCFRRDVLIAIPQYPLVNGNEDIAMWFKCIHSGFRFGNVHQPLLIFSINHKFWARRSLSKALSEFNCYLNGIWILYGLTWRYIYPVLRFLMRICPGWISKVLYNSSLRVSKLERNI